MQTAETKSPADYDPKEFVGDERAEMASMYEETLKHFAEGSIVQGRVLEIRSTEVLVDIGYKSEGLIPADEFEDLATIQEGDALEVLLERLEDEEGMVILSKRRAELQRNWDRVLDTCDEGGTIQGDIKNRVEVITGRALPLYE